MALYKSMTATEEDKSPCLQLRRQINVGLLAVSYACMCLGPYTM